MATRDRLDLLPPGHRDLERLERAKHVAFRRDHERHALRRAGIHHRADGIAEGGPRRAQRSARGTPRSSCTSGGAPAPRSPCRPVVASALTTRSAPSASTCSSSRSAREPCRRPCVAGSPGWPRYASSFDVRLPPSQVFRCPTSCSRQWCVRSHNSHCAHNAAPRCGVNQVRRRRGIGDEWRRVRGGDVRRRATRTTRPGLVGAGRAEPTSRTPRRSPARHAPRPHGASPSTRAARTRPRPS